ncbi:MAG TPA: MerR family transcriptional regulator [Nitrospirae bacterium]|nr:MerR family transcriptional regulator [Nitrospirota bacterium]
MKNMTIGKVAGSAGVSIDTVRYYERQGLIPAPPRKESGYRLYTDETIKRILFIKNAQELGFSLKEISELLALRVESRRSCSEVMGLTRQKIDEVSRKIESLESIKAVLEKLKARCRARELTSPCPILESLEIETLRSGRGS